jgi:molybdate transport system substrate-binding protein
LLARKGVAPEQGCQTPLHWRDRCLSISILSIHQQEPAKVKFAVLAASIGLSLLMTDAPRAAEIKAFLTGASHRSLDTLIPMFERESGHKIVGDYALPPALVKRVDAGEPFDVLILSYDVEGLVKQGKLAPDSRTVLGRIGIGVAVHKGAPKPDFSTVEAFKQSLLKAKSFATSGEGSSGRYVASLVERLGIADQVKSKIKSGGPGASAKMLAAGEVDFVVSGLPPLLGTPDIEWLGYLPNEINNWLLFSGGLSVHAKQAEAGRAFLKFLTSPAAVAVWKDNGLEPPQ